MDERGMSALHLAAVERVYGEHAEGNFAPAQAAPGGGDPGDPPPGAERRRVGARQDKVREWRPLVEANFVRALNHHRGTFKAKNKRLGAPHFLVSECLDAALAQIVKAGGEEGKAGNWTEHQ